MSTSTIDATWQQLNLPADAKAVLEATIGHLSRKI